MDYIARHYIKVDGRMVFPGEIFTKDMDKAAERRLLEAGAIETAVAPVPVPDARAPREEALETPADEDAANAVAPAVDVEDVMPRKPAHKRTGGTK